MPSLIARLYTFTNATLIQSAQINAELDQIIKLFSGLTPSDALRLYLNLNDDSLPPLKLMQLNAGIILDCQKSGVSKVQINGAGSIKSLVATGTQPLALNGNATNVPNLNVDFVDDIPLSNIIQNNAINMGLKGLKINLLALGVQNLIFDCDADSFQFKRSSDNAVFMFLESLNNATRAVRCPKTIVADFVPVNSTDAIRKTELDVRTAVFSQGGSINTTALNANIWGWICPTDSIITWTKIKAYYGGGTPSGTTTLSFFLNGTLVNTINILIADPTYTNNSVTLAPSILLADGDLVTCKVTAFGAHQKIGWAIIGQS